ncbi:DCC1-like thiol-disulfide oxidoreductase family protein [Rosistilla oblonga]|uniref:DCC1-like thiol-disulfide oxidoreductase family protein n=1 Tax=Rosistilla oblonga TaxID=2527990 RepID=UPI003A9809F3
MITQTDTSAILNHKWLAIGAGYAAFCFETVFIFLFWFKPAWLPLTLVGIGLHVGILVEFPIPLFALGVICLYLLLIPPELLGRLVLPPASKPSLTVAFDAECPLCRMTKATVESFDIRSKVDFIPIQARERLPAKITELTESELAATVHSVSSNGRHYQGVGTYAEIGSAIYLLWPIGLALKTPGLRSIAERIYAWVAQNRRTGRCTDTTCSIQTTARTNEMAPVINGLSSTNVASFAITTYLVAVVFVQGLMITQSPIAKNIYGLSGIKDAAPVRAIERVTRRARMIVQPLFGTTHHGVFMDTHFKDYEHQIRVTDTATGETMPVTTKEGAPGAYLTGFNWVKWSFRANGPNIDQEKLNKGIRDFSAFWIHQRGLDLYGEHKLQVDVRRIRLPAEWEYDYYRNVMKTPWQSAGAAHWAGGEFSIDIGEIESY